jgi:hypothetical protein
VNVSPNSPNKLMLSILTALAIVLAIAAPPTLSTWLRRRRRQEQG